jgi:hypothetical protein
VIKIIRASEIGAYLYCKRAWWYQRQGIQAQNTADLASGAALHQRHERDVITSGCIRALAYALLLAAFALITVYAVGRLF